jgi:hypothetical protein
LVRPTMSVQLFRPFVFALLVAIGLAPSGCGRSSAIVAPTNVSPALVERMLGGPVEMAMLGDMAAMRSDSVYGRLLMRKSPGAFDEPSTKWLLQTVDSVEFWALGDFEEEHAVTAFGILRSGRIKESELGMLDPQLKLEGRTVLPSGVVFFVGSGKASCVVFLVDGNLVVASGSAVSRAHTHFQNSRELPPKLDFGGGVLLAFHGERALFQRTSVMKNHAAKPWEARMTSASMVLRTGDLGDVFARATFEDEESAKLALEDAERPSDPSMVALVALVRMRCPKLFSIKTSTTRSGKEVTWRAEGLPAVLEALVDGTLCPKRADDEPTAMLETPARPTAIPEVGEYVFLEPKRTAPRLVSRSAGPAILASVEVPTADGRGQWIKDGAYDVKSMTWLYALEMRADARTNARNPALVGEYVVAGNRIVSARSGDVTTWDAETGKTIARFQTPARGRACVAPDGGPVLFIDDEDPARQASFDAISGKSTPASKRPSACPVRPPGSICAMQPATMAECLEPDASPAVTGFVAQEVLREGNTGVAIGERTGSERHLAMAVGFDVPSRRVRWQRVLPHDNPKVAREGSPRIADLRGGKLFVVYDAWQASWKLATIDAGSGAPLWEKDLAAPAFFTASATELFIPVAAEGIRIFDLRTGGERVFPPPAAAPQIQIATPR